MTTTDATLLEQVRAQLADAYAVNAGLRERAAAATQERDEAREWNNDARRQLAAQSAELAVARDRLNEADRWALSVLNERLVDPVADWAEEHGADDPNLADPLGLRLGAIWNLLRAERERYRQLAGEFEALATELDSGARTGSLAKPEHIAAMIRSALTATAPQPAPDASKGINWEGVSVTRGRMSLSATTTLTLDNTASPHSGPASPPESPLPADHTPVGVPATPGHDAPEGAQQADGGAEELDEALAGAMSALDWAANHISLAYEHLRWARPADDEHNDNCGSCCCCSVDTDRLRAERDEARREAERLRGEVRRTVDDMQAVAATLGFDVTPYADRLRALAAGSSDTTGGTGG